LEDRARSRRAALHRDPVGSGLQVPAVMRRGLLLALAAAAVAAGVAGVVYGHKAGRETVAILAPLGLVTVAATYALIRNRERVGGLRRQVLVSGAVIVGQLLIAVALFDWLMLVSHMDVLFTVVAVVYSSLLGLWAAGALGRRVMGDVDAVRAGLTAVGDGSREVHISTSGRDELAQLGRDVESMVARLNEEEKMRWAADGARRHLLAAVSHDLRTLREYVSRLAIHVRALSALIDDLFELSRLEAGDISWTMEQVAIGELLEETVDAMRPHAYARANPEQIQRVLFNLIQNAIRHTPADGSITVRAEPCDAEVEIEVADTGEGIDPVDRGRVFDAFVQGSDRSARTNGSAGLGLSIARAIVEAHGGRIWLAGEDAGAGTRVRFSLPRA